MVGGPNGFTHPPRTIDWQREPGHRGGSARIRRAAPHARNVPPPPGRRPGRPRGGRPSALEQQRDPSTRPMRCGRWFHHRLARAARGASRPEASGHRPRTNRERANPAQNGFGPRKQRGDNRSRAPRRPTPRRWRTDGTAKPRRCKSAPRGARRTVARQGRGRTAECRDEQKGAYSSQPLVFLDPVS